ncbi:serine/threonine-protein kinase ATG1a-like isoform X2 [Phragmites australis]|uniref:serine/threonine-protein kinase ATG1a-like isoform X2 n=1 Tax=Phragmites australis TaxID=29695 RepID=UPI002D767B17|nr:serine/threonine-protein kinase ATG1a-like isoform X2 [Phragmites australis]
MEEEGEARPKAVANQRVVGEYELQRMVGKGSFAKVFRAVHRRTGARVAVKEIDCGLVDKRVHDGILKEREILSSIDHPNILRLLDTIDRGKVLNLVLEYCDGGDLDSFLNKHGRLPETTAKDLMRQLAEGLKVLRGRNIVHRDLKPQNLLLSTNGDVIILKIGDFGFARSLMHENLAATICGSPLYMAPEIWQGKDYDAKSDLWSVGVILFQLVTGKLPFSGSNYYQLRQNILASDEVNFPSEIEADLCPDCINLCRRLLHRDPKKRINFEEFFNHKFLATTRKHELIGESHRAVDLRDTCQTTSSVVLKPKSEIFDSWEWIEREYVLVPVNCTSMEMLSSLEKSRKDDAGTRTAGYDRSTGKGSVQNQNRDLIRRVIAVQNHGCTPVSISQESSTAEDRRGKPPDYHMRLHILNQYVFVLTELAQEKLFKGLDLEALSIELVLLAIWKEALDACSLFKDASDDGNFSKSGQEHFLPKSDRSSLNVAQGLDFTRPVSVCSWVESGFMKAYDRAEKISHRLRENNDNTEMPDAMDIIFQTALEYGKSGAANEVLGHQNRSMALYSKAIILLTFILQEAPILPLNPPFSLSPSNQQRIHRYIANLKSHIWSAQVAGQQQKSVQN